MAPGNTSNSLRENETSSDSDTQKIVLNALKMAFGTMTSRVLGLFRDMAMAFLFSRSVTDAWTAAFRLPNLFRRLLGEGSMSVSFIPVFIEARLREETSPDSYESKNLINGFYTILLIILATLTLVGTIWARPILEILLDPGYIQNPAKMDLTVRLSKIMFSFIFLISTYAYFMGILNALGYYALAAMAPTLWNISMLVFTFLPMHWFPGEGDGLAWGVVVGGALQTAILIPALIKLDYLPRLIRPNWSKDISQVFRNMIPGLIGTGLLQITTVVNLRFASKLGEGAISYIYWADRLLELPLSLVSVSLGTALLPTLSEMWSRKEAAKMSGVANYYLRLNLFVSIPAALGLYFLALPIIETLFQRGKFNNQDALATAQVLKVYSLILISSSCVRVLVPLYYAVKNTWYPAMASGLSLASHIIIAPILMKNFGLKGLVSSSMISASLNMIFLLAGINPLITEFSFRKILISLVKFLPGAMILAALIQIYFLFATTGDFILKKVFILGITIFISMMGYLFVAHAFHLEEYKSTIHTLISKLKRKFFHKRSL